MDCFASLAMMGWSQARRPLGGEIAEQKPHPEQQHKAGRAEFDAAHDERAAALAAGGQTARKVLGGDGDNGDGSNRDGCAKPHHEGRGNARPEQALRQ